MKPKNRCYCWLMRNNIQPNDENASFFHPNLRQLLIENWSNIRCLKISTPPQYKMNYWLSYNEKLGTYRIDEVGKTLQSQSDDADYQTVGSSNSLEDLKNFVQTMTLISLSNNEGVIKWYHKSLVSFFENRFSKLLIRNFDGNDF